MKCCNKSCEHVTSTYTQGYYGGGESVICCQCGATKQRKFRFVPDPKHGPYAPHSHQVKKYEEE